nr:hypothetical protein [Pseudonocardia sp. AL041005-10]
MSRRHDHDAGGAPGTLARKAELREEVWTALTEQKASRFPGRGTGSRTSSVPRPRPGGCASWTCGAPPAP